tara:strand:+ start:242 stop:1120 length:879 start_codon:yes stop_codon:yes gene_type:complete
MTQYNQELFDRIDNYRDEVLNFLRSKGNYFYTNEINIEMGKYKINYHRWLHPMQGSWETTELFTPQKLGYLKKIIKENSVVLDIGAHTGNMSVAYSLFARKVISFEPNPSTFDVLNQNSKLNRNIIPYNFGCSTEDGKMEFHYSDEGFNNGGLASTLDNGIGVTGHKVPIEVYCVNVNNLLKDLHSDDYDNISFIKIDCEGHDKEILPTLKGIIEKNKPIIQTEIYDGLTDREKIELIEVIDSLGYDCYNLTEANDNIDDLGEKITKDSVSDLSLLTGHNLICFPRGINDTK